MLRTNTPSRLFLVIFVLALSALACQAIFQTSGAEVVSEATPEVLAPESEGPVTGLSPTAPGDTPASPSQAPGEPTSPPVAPVPFAQEGTLASIYEQVSPGVVSIQVFTPVGGGQGSGFVVDMDGHILTNFHVVEDASEIEVHFPSGFKVRGEVIGTDLDSDLAVLQVEAPPEELHPLPLGDSEKIRVGQTVVAIGNPFGLTGTMTVGIVSALGRTLESLNEAPGGGVFSSGDIIQTDAAINPGNSGGPLINMESEVIGVNRAIRTESFTALGSPSNSGIGFVIPVNIVKRVLPALIAEGEFKYPYLGISSLSEDLSLHIQEQLGLPQATGAYISSVVPDGPSDRGGLRDGDLIIAIDDRPVLRFGDLLSYLLNHKRPGDTVTLTVLRGDEQLELEVTVGERP